MKSLNLNEQISEKNVAAIQTRKRLVALLLTLIASVGSPLAAIAADKTETAADTAVAKDSAASKVARKAEREESKDGSDKKGTDSKKIEGAAIAPPSAIQGSAADGPLYLSKDEEDVIFRAMKDEMDRSVSKLKLGTHDLPYFVQYKVLDSESFYINASYGAISQARGSQTRRLDSDIRVGDYDLDSSKGGGSALSSLFGMSLGGGGGYISVEDDYDALRNEIWLASDSAYKKAIEAYESKKAGLKAKPESERLPEMTKVRPVVFIKPRVTIKVDRAYWEKTSRDLSAIFLKYPQIDNSVVHFSTTAGSAWLINNEGVKHRDGRLQTVLSILAKVHAPDGRTYSDVEFVAAESPDELPDYKALEKLVHKLIERLEKVASAPMAKGFSGPVLFEPEASAVLFHSVLSRTLGGAQESSREGFGGGHPFQDKLNQRVATRTLNVVDNPNAKKYEGTKLFGSYEVDDDGVPSQKITLIEQGVLKTFCTSRQPTRGVEGTNGHSGDGSGTVSILFVNGNPSLNPKQMKKKLIQLGKEQGFDHVYIVKDAVKLPTWLLGMSSGLSSIFSSFGGGLQLFPTTLIRIDVKSGKQDLVRGPTVQIQPARILKDIEALGSDETVTNIASSQSSATSIITPSVIVRDVDLQEPEKTVSRPPVVKNPLDEDSSSDETKKKELQKPLDAPSI